MDLFETIIGNKEKHVYIIGLKDIVDKKLKERRPIFDISNSTMLDKELELCLIIQHKCDDILTFMDRLNFVNGYNLKIKTDEYKNKRLQYTLDFDHNHEDLKKTLKVEDFKNEKEMIVSNMVVDIYNEVLNLEMYEEFIKYEKDKYKRTKDFIHDVYDALKKKYQLYSQIC